MTARIVVAGGGVGGLATALALAHQGHRIDVLEQSAAFGEIGAGVQLGPNVTKRLAAMGLLTSLDKIAAHPEALVVRSAGTGTELARMPLGAAMQSRYGAPYFCVHRADLHSLLLEAVRRQADVMLATGARIESVKVTGDMVCVTDADARVWEGDALVGADGLWSTVRSQVDASGLPPRSTGHTAWRSLIDQAALPLALRGQHVDVWLGPKLHAVAYPLRGGRWLNMVVIAEAAPAGDARDWDQASSLAALQRATGACGGSLQALLEAMPAWRAWTLSDREPLTSAQDMARGRVALVGDAAHPMVPYLAQGAGMAIEDAVALADVLGRNGSATVPDAFRRYAELRWQRNARVQARARRNGAIFHARGPVRWGRDLAMRAVGASLLDQPWLYGG